MDASAVCVTVHLLKTVGVFQYLVIMNKGAIDTHIRFSFFTLQSVEQMPSKEMFLFLDVFLVIYKNYREVEVF